jgi:hypothetical protein
VPPNCRVVDREAHQLGAFILSLDTNSDDDLALVGELYGVLAEVDQDLSQPQRIAFQMRWDRWLDIKDRFQTFCRRLFAGQIANVLEDLIEIEVDVLDR